MQGFSIVFFAVWAIAGNPRAALRLSILPWIAGFAAAFAILQPLVGVGLSMLASDRIPPAMHDQGYSPALLFSLFVFGIVSCWIGMTWHRHILLRETAQSMLSRRNAEAFLLYFRAMAKVAVLAAAILLFLVMDPVGNVPIFITLLKDLPAARRRLVGGAPRLLTGGRPDGDHSSTPPGAPGRRRQPAWRASRIHSHTRPSSVSPTTATAQ